MGVNSLPKTVTQQRRGCDLNPGPSAPESSTLITRQCVVDLQKSTYSSLVLAMLFSTGEVVPLQYYGELLLLLQYTISYDTRCCFNVRSIADANQLNLPHRSNTNKWKTVKLKSRKMDMLRSIGKQSRESVESVLKQKRKAMVGRICRKGRF